MLTMQGEEVMIRKTTLVFGWVLVMCVVAVAGAWQITLDGAPVSVSHEVWVADDGSVMVALDDLVPQMIDAYAFDFDGWQITIVAGEYGITAVNAGNVMRRDGFAATFEGSPVVKDQVLWFPIEALATMLNYTVERNLSEERLSIASPQVAADAEEAADAYGRRMTSVTNNAVYPRPDIAHFEDLLIPGPHGLLSARLYDAFPQDSAPRAIYINIHGGGWRVGSIASSDHVVRDIANRSGQIALSIEYGMLPEYPFPMGWEDAYAAVKWVVDHHQQLGIDRQRIFVGGDSAGGTIANGVAMMARERGEFTVAGVVLAYPVLDMSAEWAAFVFADPSDAQSPYATAKNGSLQGMPETLVLVAENDNLRPQGEEYAALLQDAGVPVEFEMVTGTSHGFLATHAESRGRIAEFIRSTGR